MIMIVLLILALIGLKRIWDNAEPIEPTEYVDSPEASRNKYTNYIIYKNLRK